MIVNGFEFDFEADYWAFLGEIKRVITCINTNTEFEETSQTGYCHFIPSVNQAPADVNAPANKNTASGAKTPHRPSGGPTLLGTIFGGQKETATRNHRWEVTGHNLVVVDTHSQYRGKYFHHHMHSFSISQPDCGCFEWRF
jgi:hypothetical protein